jgi:hypothetical protein
MSYNGATQILYMDGNLVNSSSLTGSIPVNANNLTIGSGFTGRIDEIRVSNIARSASWITTSYNNQNNSGNFYTVYKESIVGYQWVEIYNAHNSSVNLSGWTLSDNDGYIFNLTGAGSIPSGGYLVCHLGQSGTNSSTNVYGPPGDMLDDTDDLELLNSRGMIVDYVAWGGDAGSDDNDAAAWRQWTGGTYVDTSNLADNETIGRDKNSTDTDTPADWENTTTNEADPYGVNATHATPNAQNLCVIIPEFDILLIPILIMSVIILYINRHHNLLLLSKTQPNSGKKKDQKIKKYSNKKIRTQTRERS